MKLTLYCITLSVARARTVKNAADPVFRRTTTHIIPARTVPRLEGLQPWKKL